MVLIDGLKTSVGVFNTGAIVEVNDSPKLQALAVAGDIEYCNPAQVGLFDV